MAFIDVNFPIMLSPNFRNHELQLWKIYDYILAIGHSSDDDEGTSKIFNAARKLFHVKKSELRESIFDMIT